VWAEFIEHTNTLCGQNLYNTQTHSVGRIYITHKHIVWAEFI